MVPTAGDLVFSYETRIGQAALIPEGLRCCLGRRLALARPKSAELNSRYLLYFYLSPGFQDYLRAHTMPGSTVDRLHLTNFPKFPITIPPRIYQEAIAELLGALDDKIELNRRMVDVCQQLARTLFKSWFVDFDPVCAKADARPTGLPEEIVALFPSRIGDDGMPNGWRRSSLQTICSSIFSGGTPSTTEEAFWGGSIPWLSSGETRSNFILKTEKTITELAVANSSARMARAGTSVIASAGQGNTRGQTSMLLIDTYINQSIVALAANRDFVSEHFLYFDLERRYEEFRRISDGQSSRGSLTTKLLGGLETVLPPRKVVDAFDHVAVPVVAGLRAYLEQISVLTEIRDALLPKLISGELHIKDAEQMVGAA